MPPEQSEAFESRPSALTSDPAQEAADGQDHGTVEHPLLTDHIRGIVRLIQCRRCSYPLRDPIILPCGRSLCRECLPETQSREGISYPAIPSRLQGFDCPFPECGKLHALSDCGADVVLGKAINHFTAELRRGKMACEGGDVSTHIMPRDHWAIAGVTSLSDEDVEPRVVDGGRLLATFTMVETGSLKYETDVSFLDDCSLHDDAEKLDETSYMRIKEAVRTEMDCQVCYALFYDPLTTVCGHTFCRGCLHRVLDHSLLCPICRQPLSLSPLLNQQSHPPNDSLTKIINTFWADAVMARGDALAAEALNRHRDFDIPVFICTLSFPMMPTFLHIFEPRYRLMIRRCLEGDRTFGMVLHKRPRNSQDTNFVQHGTLLRIVNAEYFADGRSLVETIGISRFKVIRHGTLDGYTVAQTERIDDISLAEEEETEANEAHRAISRDVPDPLGVHDGEPESAMGGPETALTEEDLSRLPTSEMLAFAIAFVDRMRQQSVPWLTHRILSLYGDCPHDAAHFPWWFASILPVKELEKYKLLGTTSVRERLKICCIWALGWESSRWGNVIDGRSGTSQTAGSSNSTPPPRSSQSTPPPPPQ